MIKVVLVMLQVLVLLDAVRAERCTEPLPKVKPLPLPQNAHTWSGRASSNDGARFGDKNG